MKCLYSGLFRLKNSERAQTMNSCPTFSSVDILLNVRRTHFSPSRSERTGPVREWSSFAKAELDKTRRLIRMTRLMMIRMMEVMPGDLGRSLIKANSGIEALEFLFK